MSLLGITDQHPFGKFHYAPRTEAPFVASEDQISGSLQGVWSNTFNQKNDAYLVDSEDREFRGDIYYGVTKNLSVTASMPVSWSGAGFTDGPIENWDKLLGFPNHPRQNRQKNIFEIEGINKDGSKFSIPEPGTGVGDLTIGTRYLANQESADSPQTVVGFDLTLPIGNGIYSQDSVDVTSLLLVGKSFDASKLIFGGVSGTYRQDNSEYGLHFKDTQFSGFVEFAYDMTEDLRFSIAPLVQTSSVDDLAKYPKTEEYLDLSLQIRVSETVRLGLLLRENPLGGSGTTDVSLCAAISI